MPDNTIWQLRSPKKSCASTGKRLMIVTKDFHELSYSDRIVTMR